MTKKEIDEILSDSYSWIKVNKYEEVPSDNPMVEWGSEYKHLMKHHEKETGFLINKCKELAKHIKNNNILI